MKQRTSAPGLGKMEIGTVSQAVECLGRGETADQNDDKPPIAERKL
jgi:hypothetical protein